MNVKCQRISVELYHAAVTVYTRAELVKAVTCALQGRVFKHGEVLEVFFWGLMVFDDDVVCRWKADETVTPSISFDTNHGTGEISLTWHNWDSVHQEARDWVNQVVEEA